MMNLTRYPYLYSDCCIVDKNYNLIFLSVWGRDTATQELLAKLSLTKDEKIQLSDEKLEINIYANKQPYTKNSSRYKQSNFGTLVHTFIYDIRCIEPDRENLTAIVLINNTHSVDAIWSTFKNLCHLPVLEHWQTIIIDLLFKHQMIEKLYTHGSDSIAGYFIKLDINKLQQSIAELIQNSTLQEAA